MTEYRAKFEIRQIENKQFNILATEPVPEEDLDIAYPTYAQEWANELIKTYCIWCSAPDKNLCDGFAAVSRFLHVQQLVGVAKTLMNEAELKNRCVALKWQNNKHT
jgi:hypothetical protein